VAWAEAAEAEAAEAEAAGAATAGRHSAHGDWDDDAPAAEAKAASLVGGRGSPVIVTHGDSSNGAAAA